MFISFHKLHFTVCTDEPDAPKGGGPHAIRADGAGHVDRHHREFLLVPTLLILLPVTVARDK
jgi:hypothetical protein